MKATFPWFGTTIYLNTKLPKVQAGNKRELNRHKGDRTNEVRPDRTSTSDYYNDHGGTREGKERAVGSRRDARQRERKYELYKYNGNNRHGPKWWCRAYLPTRIGKRNPKKSTASDGWRGPQKERGP